MKTFGIIVIMGLICLLCGCSHEMQNGEILQTKVYADVDNYFSVTRICKFNQDDPTVLNRSVLEIGQSLFDNNRTLRRLGRSLYRKFKQIESKYPGTDLRIKFAIDETLEDATDFTRKNKDAYFDPTCATIYFASLSMAIDKRIILHELLHAFQFYLGGVDFNAGNLMHTEFEVLFIYDILQCQQQKKRPDTMEGGYSHGEYGSFVWSIARSSASQLENKWDDIVNKFNGFYKARYPNNGGNQYEEDAFFPGFLRYFIQLL